MSEHLTPVAIARTFTEAWTRHDMETAASYLAENVVFDGPANRTTGKDAYLQGLNAFAQAVTAPRILADFGDDSQALIMYEVTMGPGGVVRGAELLTIRDGKIVDDKLTFTALKTSAPAEV